MSSTRFANPRPATPNLDLVEQEAKALATWEKEQERLLVESTAKRAAEAATRAARERVASERRAQCEQAARDADAAVKTLADALTRYRQSLPVPPYQVAARLRIFLGNALGDFGPMERNTDVHDPLLGELHQEKAI